VKTVGVLGGLGPQATMEFESLVHGVAQRLIRPHVNSGYPPMLVGYFRGVPFIADAAGVPEPPLRPSSALLSLAADLGRVSDFLVVTSNFVHLFQAEIEAVAGRGLLSMVELALDEVSRRGWERVGVLGFGDPVVYADRLRTAGTVCETIAGEGQARLDVAIQKVMEGRADTDSAHAAEQALEELRARQIDGTILACTEIPILLGHPATDTDLIDPLPLLAEATVRHALG
jgi:aspartate racemase